MTTPKDLSQVTLAHIGVLGMHWGHRKLRAEERRQYKIASSKKTSLNPFGDDRSLTTVKLGEAAAAASVAAVGSIALTRVFRKNPKVQVGLRAANIILGAASIGLAGAEFRSSRRDVINKYGTSIVKETK
jgi:hypothetical protein